MKTQICMDKKSWRIVINTVSKLVDDCRLMCLQDRIEIVTVDPAHVAMMILKVKKESMLAYKFEPRDENEIRRNEFAKNMPKESPDDINKFGQYRQLPGHDACRYHMLDVEWFREAFKMADEDSPITLEYLNDDRLRAIVRFEVNKEKAYLRFHEEGIEEFGWVSVPNMVLAVKAVLPTKYLCKVVRSISTFSDHCSFTANEKAGIFIGSTQCGKVESRVMLVKVGSAVISSDPGHTYSSLYPMDYMANWLMSATFAEAITVKMGQDLPIRFEVQYGDGLSIEFLLAPRIENYDGHDEKGIIAIIENCIQTED